MPTVQDSNKIKADNHLLEKRREHFGRKFWTILVLFTKNLFTISEYIAQKFITPTTYRGKLLN